MAKSEQPIGRLNQKVKAEVSRRVQESIDRSTNVILSHNTKSIPEEFSEAFSSAGGDFKFQDREELMRGLESGALKYESIKTRVEKVDVATENLAVVTGVRSVKAVIRGDEFASTFPFKAVHALEDGKWKVVLWAVNC